MNTLVLAPFSDDGLAALRSVGSVRYEPWTQTKELHDPEELGTRLRDQGFQALVVEADFLFEELFAQAHGLRFAAICRAALNQVDLDAATEHRVVVVHTPGRNAQAVAEMVMGLVYSLARHIPQASSYVSTGRWQDPTEAYTAFRGRELADATLGVIGFGAIGKSVAKLARNLGMHVVAYDPYVQPGSRGTAGVRFVDLETLLRAGDFITLHVPETPETTGLINGDLLSLVRPSAYIVNVTSPAVVDQNALASALREGRLAGAAMDVHDAHPIPSNSPFLGMPNVLLTPHIGGATHETVQRHSQMVVSDMQRFLKGQRPRHLANPAVWRRHGR
jgi:D-3-phosphoglycerate dehydrogenase / 2-oxoglutarate reductase